MVVVRLVGCRRAAAGGVAQVVAQAVQAALPQRAALGDPVLGRAQRRRVDLAGTGAAYLLGSHEPARLQNLNMPASGIRQCVKYPVQVSGPVEQSSLVKHILEYAGSPANSQADA